MGPCSTAPWWSLACVFLPRSGQSILRPSLGLLMVGRLTALIMSLCLSPGTVAPGGVVVTLLALRRLATLLILVFATLLILVLFMLLTPRVIGRTIFLWRYVLLWSSGGRHVAPSGRLRALIVPPSRTLFAVLSSGAL